MESATVPNGSRKVIEIRPREAPKTTAEWADWLDRRERDLSALVAAGKILLLTADRDRPDLARALVRHEVSCRTAIAALRFRLRVGLLPRPDSIERAQRALFACMREVIEA